MTDLKGVEKCSTHEQCSNLQNTAPEPTERIVPSPNTNPVYPDTISAAQNATNYSPSYSKVSMVMMVVFSGLAIGSDGFNASIIGNIELLMEVIYPKSLTTAVAARLSNAFMVGMIIGMLSFGYISDKLGRKTGAVLTTTILVLGIALSAGASGLTEDGMFWMLIIARGIAGIGAGG